MLIPKRTKYRKPQRLTYDGHARGNTELHFGEYGLQAREGAWISARQIEAARIAMTRYMKRGGKVYINIFPHLALTRKPHRISYDGHARGNTELHFGEYGLQAREGAWISARQIEAARIAMTRYLRLASHKLPIKTKFVKKEGESHEN